MPIHPHQLQLLQQKLTHLQADNMIYQDQLTRLRRRIIELEQYRIKYQLLLEKQTEESPLYRSRRVDQISNMNRKIEESSEKWALKLKLMEGKYEKVIRELEDKNLQLTKELQTRTGENRKTPQTTTDPTPSPQQQTTLRQQLTTLRTQHTQLASQTTSLRSQNTHLTHSLQQSQSTIASLQHSLQHAKLEERQFYRGAITELQQRVKNMQEQVEYWKVRASPEREGEIGRLVGEIRRVEKEGDGVLGRFGELVKGKDAEVERVLGVLEASKAQALETITGLQDELEHARSRLFSIEQQHHHQLMSLRLQFQQQKSLEITQLKASFTQLQNSFTSQRQQWSLILQNSQQELLRIKKMWDQQRQRFTSQKNDLKRKINELKERERTINQQDKQKEKADNQTFKLIQSLKLIDEQENKYNDTQNNVTFFARQLKRATSKIQEKQRQCAKLLTQLYTQRQEFQTETEFIKRIERQQVDHYKGKLLQADQQISKLLQEIREKDKYLRGKEGEYKAVVERLRFENQELSEVVKQMERDYNRLVDNKKNLYQSYRSQRDLVFTGKTELNQERKNKWLELDRQKNELEIAYKEREKQIRLEFQLKVNELQERLSRVSQQKEIASAEVDILKERVREETGRAVGKRDGEQVAGEFHKKLASMDLQISLAQNLYSTIKTARERTSHKKPTNTNRSELDGMSLNQSESSLTSREQKIHDLQSDSIDSQSMHENVAPTFAHPSTEEKQGSDEYQNFSFKAQEVGVREERREGGNNGNGKSNGKKKNYQTEGSFRPGEEGGETPMWRL